MDAHTHQLGLFDDGAVVDATQAALARAGMRATIARLTQTVAPPWKDQTGVILEDGAFRRAMRLVPAAEGEALWADYDAQMERLCAEWEAGSAG
jgi:hypothetical protein